MPGISVALYACILFRQKIPPACIKTVPANAQSLRSAMSIIGRLCAEAAAIFNRRNDILRTGATDVYPADEMI
jgi:hypothetical protein